MIVKYIDYRGFWVYDTVSQLNKDFLINPETGATYRKSAFKEKTDSRFPGQVVFEMQYA